MRPTGPIFSQEMAQSLVPYHPTLAALAKGILYPTLKPSEMGQPQKEHEALRRRFPLWWRITKKPVASYCGHKGFHSKDHLVRKVEIMTTKDGQRKFFERTVHKLVLLLATEDNH